MPRSVRLFKVILAVVLTSMFSLAAAFPCAAAGSEVLVFAAASTTDAVKEIGALYAQKGLGAIKGSFASSSTLAKQIEQGAPADVFLSANLDWMDYLAKKKLVADGTRANLLRNRVALIVPRASKVPAITVGEGTNLVSLLGKDGRIAIGDPAHVPVGMYGKQALETLKIWDSVKDRIAPAKDVRAGLALVERGEAPLGIVYESDVAASDKVRVIGVFPTGSHPEVVYPVAAVAGKNADAARKFIAFLGTPEAKAIFKKHGFEGM